MKEIILRSKKFSNLILQIFDGNDFGMLGEEKEKKEKNEGDWFTDNNIYAYEILKLLREAEKKGCFENIKKDDIKNNNNEDREEILI